MYRGFNLKLNSIFVQEVYDLGLKQYEEDKVVIKNTIDSFALPDGSLDGSKLQENWFPQIKSNIFLSHSHKDEKMAIVFAGILSIFGVKTFIDSCIWGYANNLLKIIDDKYCLNEGGNTYSYEKRNYSTSYVHLMLSTALTKMIDNTECLFFLNTPNSITSSSVVNETESPWIYYEIAISQSIRQQELNRYRIQEKSRFFAKAEYLNENLRIKHKLDLKHLSIFNMEDFAKWMDILSPHAKDITAYDALDVLYNIKPAKDLEDIIN